MDLIPLADPVRIKTIPRDDPSAEAAMAGALAAFLSVLAGEAGDTPTPGGQSARAGSRTEVAATSGTPVPFFDDTAPPAAGTTAGTTAGTPDTSAGPAPAPAGEDVLREPALSEVLTGVSDAGIAGAEADAPAAPDAPARRGEPPGPHPATWGSPQAGGRTAVGERATGPEPGGAAREMKSGASHLAAPAQAAMPGADVPVARPTGASADVAGRTAGAPDLRSGERVSAGYTVIRAEPVRGAPVPPQDQGAPGARNTAPASDEAPRVPAADDRASAAPGLRQIAVPTASAAPAPESFAEARRDLVTAETSEVGRQTPPVTPTRPAGAQTIGGPAGPVQPAAAAAPQTASHAADDASPVRAGRQDAAEPPVARTVAASPTVAAGRGEALPTDSAVQIPTAPDAEPTEIPIEPGDALASTAGAAPLSPGADRVVAGHPATGALPPGLGHRLAEAVSQFPDRPVEITLSPEELGRVRLTLTTQDGALTMMIQADRPETLDLMRRNIDSLAQDFRDLGYQELTFSFGQERTPRQSPDAAATIAAAGKDARPEIAATEAPDRDRVRIAADGGGLDLRL